MRHLRRIVALVLLLGAMVSLMALFSTYLRQPTYEGKRIGYWFAGLCQGAFANHDVERWKSAEVAFSRMDSNAVPYLLEQLCSDRSGQIERMLLRTRTIPILNKVTERAVPPSNKRAYAAVALRALGTNATSGAVPLSNSGTKSWSQVQRTTSLSLLPPYWKSQLRTFGARMSGSSLRIG
jgi:hypothetical protein